ncbi:hypothetical protein PHYSODRAFT_257126 [Phytophthora sojae]|uniref:FYVE-type domain-containing protein n=1 Tax=Phytophthora sojae (strain P6497) TaxID=1094619 RepID=G4ZW42_PHYSP|nr:hypothetical protein PHYSODRAFT_257126 [Phytophthora sojae]EGZ12324.1 hypothetical protein PHYSODRAFT_257126 [Phytophthora sojae]|eukprot:XP_009532657.1 hypothetical protein PHYSODRAFT_257126 [Phytophthora sojae]
MPRDLFAETPYAGLRVSEEVKHQLIDLENELLVQHFQQYEEYVAVDNRRVDEHRWEHFKSKEDLHVYEDRFQHSQSWNAVVPTKSGMPVMLRVGTVPGRLDDLMFGVVNPTLGSMRIQTSYVHDVDAAAILCPIDEPSEEEPFRSLVIKWLPLDASLIKKARDFVYIEATGILHFGNGDRVGYHLKHSVELNQTNPQPNVIRANLSYCSFYRQSHTNVIDVFGTMALGGKIGRYVSVRVATEALLSTYNLVFCAQMKKMSWMLQQQRSMGLQRGRNKSCVMCNKDTSSGIIGRIGKSTCNLCYGSVCHSCRINWRISFIALGGKLVQRKIAFCATCISKASVCDPKQAARDQATGYGAYKSLSTASRSDTTEVSNFSVVSYSDPAEVSDYDYRTCL